MLCVEWGVPLIVVRQLAGPRVALQGNLDPAILLGPQEKIRAATLGLIAELAGQGHILNLGHGILPNTPVENAQLFIHTGQKAGIHESRPAVQARS